MNEQHDPATDRLARLLGWASLGLGAAQLAAPRAVCRLAGVDGSRTARTVVPLVGVREMLHAALLLGSRRPAPWAWTRVAGDAVDLTALGRALASRRGDRRLRAAAVTAGVAAITAADLYAATRGPRPKRAGDGALRLHAAVTVKRPRDEVYRFWRDFTNLPRFMAHLESVETTGDGHTRWRARGPARHAVEWDADIVQDDPGELIAWRSTGRTRVDNAGAVRFADAPADRGTELHVTLAYEQPAGRAGAIFARLLGEHPEQQVRDDLRRLKQVLETGEVIRSDAGPEGARAPRRARRRPARPLPAH